MRKNMVGNSELYGINTMQILVQEKGNQVFYKLLTFKQSK